MFNRGLALALVVLLVAVAAVAFPARDTRAGATDPVEVVESLFAEVNAGDPAGAAALVTDDFVFTDVGDGSFAVVGPTAFAGLIEGAIDANLEITVVEIEADGNTVTGAADFAEDQAVEAGVDRYRQPFTVEVTDEGLISRADFTYDLDDPQTVTYLEYLAAQPDDGDEPPPPGLVTVALAPQPGGSQPGSAFIFTDEGVTLVALEIVPGPTGVLQPAHFHTGTCAAPGPIVQPLAFPLDGESFTILSAPMSELVDTGLIINVHKSVAEASVYVACGEVLSAAAPPPAPTAAPPPPATPTPATGIVAPSTGTGDSGGGGARGTHVLLVAGMALVLGAGALAFARRRA